MTIYSITVINTASGCDNEIVQVLTVTSCSSYIVKVSPDSPALGPFDIYVNDILYYSGVTLEEMLIGVVIELQCVTPTPTLTPTPTPTLTPTPTNTPTPTSPGFMAYIFAEPQTSGDSNTLLTWAGDNGALEWGDYFDGSVPNNNGGNYSNDLDVYAHQPSFISGGGNFVQPTILSAPILQSAGSYLGCSQNIYTFGSIPVIPTTNVNSSIPYFYSIWIPLMGVGGSFNNMTIDLGTSLCGNQIYGDIQGESTLSIIDVNVTSGASIPFGTYRVLWLSPNLLLPGTLPLGVTYYFRGKNKT